MPRNFILQKFSKKANWTLRWLSKKFDNLAFKTSWPKFVNYVYYKYTEAYQRRSENGELKIHRWVNWGVRFGEEHHHPHAARRPERHQENGEGRGHALPDAHQFHHPPLRDGRHRVQSRGVKRWNPLKNRPFFSNIVHYWRFLQKIPCALLAFFHKIKGFVVLLKSVKKYC